MYCDRLHARWSTQLRLTTLLSSLIARQRIRPQTLWRFRVKELSVDERVGPDVVVLLLLTFSLLLLPLWESVIVLCFVVQYFLSLLVLQSSWWGRESWLLCLVYLPGVSWLLCGSSSRCHGFVCSLWLWHSLIILTFFLLHLIISIPDLCILLYFYESFCMICDGSLFIAWGPR